MIRIAICDDEKNIREQLKSFCRRLEQELPQSIEILEFSSASTLLESSLVEVDILLLDIKMDDLDGLTAAERIRKIVPDLCILFITSMVQYAIFGYRVRAFSFLPKPVFYQRFRQELLAAICQLGKRDTRYLVVPGAEKGTQIKIDLKEVLFFEVRNHFITIHMQNECVEYRGQMKTLQAQLGAQSGFFRCHAAYMVNYRHIKRIDTAELQLTNGAHVPVSKQRRKEFLAALTDYAGGQIV